jgi:hypothetical protein
VTHPAERVRLHDGLAPGRGVIYRVYRGYDDLVTEVAHHAL